ncbi:subdued [Carabus blaptoides fortunei]
MFNDKTHPDIVAMSVLSLYDKDQDTLETELDVDKDLSTTAEINNTNNANIYAKVNENLLPDAKIELNSTDINNCQCDCAKSAIYFRDGLRSVDFVLVWDTLTKESLADEAYERRKIFERKLVEEGLDLEYEPVEDNGLNFIKIHAPKEVLRCYSEILKLRMPMKEVLISSPSNMRQNSRLQNAANYISYKIPALRTVHTNTNYFLDSINTQWERLKCYVLVDKEHFPERGHRFTAVYSRDKEYLFNVDHPCFFTPAIHSRIVQFILDRKRFSENVHDDFAFGIERLLDEKVYAAAYPCHDGDLKQPGSMRHLLFTEWAAISKCIRYQPLDYVKEYFGVKIALYFAWLGFYTHMLLFAAIVGLGCFIYSCATLYTNTPSEDICNKDLKIQMCPLCDHWCDYWDLRETCLHSRVTYLFDNATTVFFAIFMSFWATLFLELWKRYSAEITHRWDLTGFDVQEEHPRPHYLARLSHIKRVQMNVVTNTMEPQVPFWRMRLPATILSFSVVLLLVALAMAAVLGVVLYRMSVLAALSLQRDSVITSNAILFTTITAASINLCCIFVFNWIYTWVAEYLTEVELLRTQTEFDDSLTLKIYLLQFVNYYASIFYIAFFKGKFVGYPGYYNKLFNYRQEECGPGGCLLELCIQLAIIMVGKQAMNTALEMFLPFVYKSWNTLRVKKVTFGSTRSSMQKAPQWVRDFKLLEWGPRGLFPEYLEMVLQYGFVTIFVAAFPLAPFFALLNNVLEMRFDAQKLLTFYRRPVTQRVRDIGVWYRILDSIGKLSVITNGFIIAFTSNFIPRLVYMIEVNKKHNLEGYLNHSLSYFNTSDFLIRSAPRLSVKNVTMCRYPDYREPPDSKYRYELTSMFWHVLAARLAFVVVFENIVAFVMIVVRWCIPDIPCELRDRIRKEAYVTNEIIIKQETMRAQSSLCCDNAGTGLTESVPKINESRKINIVDCPTTQEQWDRLVNKSLSGSEFDLIVHSNSQPSLDTIDKLNNDGEDIDLKSPTSV